MVTEKLISNNLCVEWGLLRKKPEEIWRAMNVLYLDLYL